MMSPPFFALLLGFIGAPLLIYLIFGLIGKQPLLGKLLFKLLPASDPQFVRFMQWVILWFLCLAHPNSCIPGSAVRSPIDF
jgi:hypothetical protein